MKLKFWKKDKTEAKQDIVKYRDGVYFFGTGSVSTPKISNTLQASKLSDVVYSCISLITQAALDVPWYLYRRQGKKIIEVEDHPTLIPFLENPSKEMTWPDFIEAYLNYILLSGNCYSRILVGSFGTYGEIDVIRPDRVKIDRDYAGNLRYRVSMKGQLVPVDAEEMLHLKLFNPADDLLGLSPISSIAIQVDIASYAQAWMLALLEKGAMPAVALSTDASLNDDQRADLKEQIQKQILGYENVMNPLILEGGLKPEKMSLSPSELDFMPLTKSILRKICGVYSVAPELLGDSENKTYSNVKEAEKSLYEKAVSPHLKRLRDKLNARVVPLFDRERAGYFFDFDMSNIEALSEDRKLLWERIGKAVEMGIITRNEGREEIKYGKAKDEGADKLTVSVQTVPLEAVAAGIEPLDDNNDNANPK